MSWVEILHASVGGALVFLASIGIVLSLFMPALDKWNRRYLATFFSMQLVCIVLSFADAIFYLNPDLAVADRIAVALGFFALTPLLAMPTLFLLHSAKENIGKSPLFIAVLSLLLLYFGMLVAAQFTDIFYVINDQSEYIRGPLFPLFLSPLVVILILDLVALMIKRKKMLRRYFVAFLVYLPPMTAATTLHMFFSLEFIVLVCVGLWALSLLGLVISQNVGQYMRQQREIAHQKESIMVLQMRPHFIYNTMTSIYYLCDQDPEKAKQVTLDFTTYLRKNFAAIASENLIPFTEELEHTRAYLSVEQAQFEDNLFVSFNTPHTLFFLPPLTLQPIVENAVKHGMRESNAPIHIYVTTKKTEKETIILVEDDGPGFKPSDDNEPHIALSNIRGRLEFMCRGTLDISSRPEGGTSVRITLPLKAKGKEQNN